MAGAIFPEVTSVCQRLCTPLHLYRRPRKKRGGFRNDAGDTTSYLRDLLWKGFSPSWSSLSPDSRWRGNPPLGTLLVVETSAPTHSSRRGGNSFRVRGRRDSRTGELCHLKGRAIR